MGQDLVRIVAMLITEDPNVVRKPSRVLSEDSMSFTIKAEDLELANGVWGDVTYEYDVQQRGRHVPASMYEPPDYPEYDVVDVRVVGMQLVQYDEDGNPVGQAEPTPELVQSAINQFPEQRAIDRAADKWNYKPEHDY